MVELVDPAQQQPLDQHTQQPHQQRRRHQHHPVVDAEVVHGHPGANRPQHEQGPMCKIDDVEQAENHGQAQTQDCIERTVDQPQKELAHQARQ
ncbi:hypothetical protein D3C78_1568410 [compost metagenome]